MARTLQSTWGHTLTALNVELSLDGECNAHTTADTQ